MADTKPLCPFCVAGCCRGTDAKYTHAQSQSPPPLARQQSVQRWSQVAAAPAPKLATRPLPNGHAAPAKPGPKENLPPTPDRQLNGTRDLNRLRERPAKPAAAPTPNTSQSLDMLFRQWRFPADATKVRRLGPGVGRFFQQALTLVSGEAGIMQEAISQLATEGGLKLIGELVNERSFETMKDEFLIRIFETQFVPFFQTLSHKNVLASALIEDRRATILNYLFGVGGVRATVLFAGTVRYLSVLKLTKTKEDAGETAIQQYHASWEASLETFAAIIATNSSAQLSEGLRAVVTRLSECVGATATPLSRVAARHFSKIERMVARVIPNARQTTDKDRAVKPVFELLRELPGDLSPEGCRHDNDCADIREIKIMPTLSEIQSLRSEYLPGCDASEWHVGGLRGLLDRHFRLLREDTVGQLRDAARMEFDRLQNPAAYEDFVGFNFDASKGLTLGLAFDQPYDLARRSASGRQEWWDSSRRMGNEALICLLAPGSVLFCVVTEQKVNRITPVGHVADENGQGHVSAARNLYSDPFRAYIAARLVGVSEEEVKQLMNHVSGSLSTASKSVVEFPGVLLPAFESTLLALQKMAQSEDMPFADILAPEETKPAEVTAPAYASDDGFTFDLSCIATGRKDLKLAVDCDVESAAQEVAQDTSLDHGQARALVSILTHSFAATQGPPGTGKTYLGIALVRALVANKKAAGLGPVIICCSTNHALDQILEHVVDAGVGQVIRIGFGSKSERLSDINLARVAEKATQTRKEKEAWWTSKKEMEAESQEINELLHKISLVETPKSIRDYLELNYPDQAMQLFGGVDDEGFETVNYGAARTLSAWLYQLQEPTLDQDRPLDELTESNVLEMSSTERRTLYQHWMSDTREAMQSRLKLALDTYRNLKEKRQNISADLNLRVLAQSNVIGLTTSGLARNLNLVRRLPSKVLLIEEAAEVLEAHILTTLLPSLEQVILIGDHQQLRPRIANYDLSCENPRGQCGLDISLFERLVRPRDGDSGGAIPLSTLDTQRRMHPSIASLVRDTLYPNLQDHPSLAEYDEVVGMRRRLFWLDHDKPENLTDLHSTSHVNDYEVDMVAALVSHIIKQAKYKPSELAILTPYLGQLRSLRTRLRKMFEILIDDRDIEDLQNEGDDEAVEKPQVTRGTLLQALRLASVDNFQGEEAKVVIVSLVRSNEQQSTGFLRSSNRINVLLSRAQHGLYIIGNAHTQSKIPMWRHVLSMLQESGNIGNTLELACPRHPDIPIEVKEADDFLRVSPEGGCDQRCGLPMANCSHICEAGCHSHRLHQAQQCSKPCSRQICPSHTCGRLCSEKCPSVCSEIITGIDIELPCGHRKTSLPCHQYQDLENFSCDAMVKKVVSSCGHEVVVLCYEDASQPNFRCTATCGAPLDCGHVCKKTCCQCAKKNGREVHLIDHGSCQSTCDKQYACGHYHKGHCHNGKDCPPCTMPVNDSCAHTKRLRACCEPSVPCTKELFSVNGGNEACSVLCALPVYRSSSSKRCSKKLHCGCQCPCPEGEACPTPYDCPQCCPDQKRKAILAEASSNLARDPLIVPVCGHVVNVSVLDAYLTTTDGDGAEHSMLIREKGCPTCQGPIDSLLRYCHIAKAARLDTSSRKIHTRFDETASSIASRLAEETEHLGTTAKGAAVPSAEICLAGEPTNQIRTIMQLETSMNTNRYVRIHQVRDELQRNLAILQSIEQPFKVLRERAETMVQATSPGPKLFAVTPRVDGLQRSLVVLLAQCDIAIVTDLMQRVERRTEGDKKSLLTVDFKINRERCVGLISEAKTARMTLLEAQGHCLWATYASLEYRVSERSIDTECLEPEAAMHVAEALELCKTYSEKCPFTMSLDDAFDASLAELRNGGQDLKVPNAVTVTGLPSLSSGRWYKCVNGHPFAAEEDGSAADAAVCYYCAEGVTPKRSAEDRAPKTMPMEATAAVDGEDLIGL